MTRASLAALFSITALAVGCAHPGSGSASAASSSPLQTEEQKTIYAMGLVLGRNIVPLKLSPTDLELLKRGLSDAASGQKPEVELETYGPKIQQLLQTRAQASAQEEKTKSESFRAAAAKEQGAVRTASGLIYKTMKPGTGASPTAQDVVRVHYEGTLVDGTVFDSSVKRGEPAEFPLKGVIPCWTEGVQKMKVGEKARFVCPSDLAYGDRGQPPKIPGGATLVFQVELLDIKKK